MRDYLAMHTVHLLFRWRGPLRHGNGRSEDGGDLRVVRNNAPKGRDADAKHALREPVQPEERLILVVNVPEVVLSEGIPIVNCQ